MDHHRGQEGTGGETEGKKSERETTHERLLIVGNRFRGAGREGRGMGQLGARVREAHDEHGVSYKPKSH